jgi:cytochrome c oxidase subunit II
MTSRRIRYIAPLLALAMFSLSAFAGAEAKWPKAEGYWLPEAASTYAQEIDNLFYGILYLTGAVFVVTELLLLVFVLKYRRQEGRKSIYTHGNHKLEMIWTITPAIILAVIAFVQKGTWDKIKSPSHLPKTDIVNVQLFAEQFQWNFRYPGTDKKWGTDDDVLTVKELYAPVNKNIVIEQTSKDVIHSLFLPYMRVKQDVVPGMHLHVWFNPTKTTKQMQESRPPVKVMRKQSDGSEKEVELIWNYEIVCAELCGSEHSQMNGKVYVLTQEEYDAKMQELSAKAKSQEPPAIWERWPVADQETGKRKFPEKKKEETKEEGH